MRPHICLAAAAVIASATLTPASAVHEFCVQVTTDSGSTSNCNPFPSPSSANCVTQTVTDPEFVEIVICFPNPRQSLNTAR